MSVHFLRTGEVGQLHVAQIGDVDAARGDVSMQNPFFVEQGYCRHQAGRVEACLGLRYARGESDERNKRNERVD